MIGFFAEERKYASHMNFQKIPTMEPETTEARPRDLTSFSTSDTMIEDSAASIIMTNANT